MRTLTFKRLIGSGAMGTVYEAELGAPRGFCRPCAVKVMKSATPDHEHFLARMRDEARLLGMLRDEHILGVTELVMVDGRDAVVMEYVEGADLAELVREERLPPRALAELGAEVAGTLRRAHTAKHPSSGEPLNVIHRDVKPANVMVTVRGGIRLLDFGVARAVFSSRESQTQGLVLGTLNYFPPEVLAGNEPSVAVDVYGLGLTLWECATGRDWGSPQHRRDAFDRRLEQRLADLGPGYSRVIPVLRRMLAWAPADRPHGGEVEKLMLSVADGCEGEGLRTWARRVVPGLLARRKASDVKDPLVGRRVVIATLPEELSVEAMPPVPLQFHDPTSVTHDEMRSPFAPKVLEEEPAPPSPAAVPARTPKAKPGPRMHVWAVALVAFLGVLTVGSVLVLVVLLVILVALRA